MCKRIVSLIIVSVGMVFVLSACAKKVSEAEAESALRLGLEGKPHDANQYFCPAAQQPEDNVIAVDEIRQIDCIPIEDGFSCKADFVLDKQLITLVAHYKLEKGKLCSPNLSQTAAPLQPASQPNQAVQPPPPAVQINQTEEP